MKTTQILPFRALDTRASFMYEGRMYVKLSSTDALYLGSSESVYIPPGAPVEV